MINTKIFFKGLFSIKRLDSPGIALGASFIAIGALLKNIGFTIQESIFSSFLIYALPGSLVLAESMIISASLLNIFLAVWLVNARLYPMTVSLMPLVIDKNQQLSPCLVEFELYQYQIQILTKNHGLKLM